MKKWYINTRVESVLAKNPHTLKYLFYQALDDLDQNRIKTPTDYPTDLTFLRENHRYLELLRHVSKFDGYGDLIFPHCPCDSRKSGGHVILELSSLGMRLRACSPEGELEQPAQCVEFGYERVVQLGVDDDEMAIWFEMSYENRPSNKRIKIYTGFVIH